MRNLFLLLLSLVIFNSANSQLRIAIVGGIHAASVKEKTSLANWDSLESNYTSRTGVKLGFIADVPVKDFGEGSSLSFQPGVIFSSKGRKYAGSMDTLYRFRADSIATTLYTESGNEFINYIDFPLNLVFKKKIGRKNTQVIVGAGPYFSFFYNGKQTMERFVQGAGFSAEKNEDLPVGNEEGKYRVINFGVNALAGLEFGRVFITLNFSRGLTNSYERPGFGEGYKHQLFGGTLGVFLGRPSGEARPVKDKDNDGLADFEDECPDVAGPAATNGCPDRDNDGLADKNDLCPDIAGPVSNNGCPLPDTDNDGINDPEDKCPTVAGTSKYNGCPIPDSDLDGINDEEDRCPNDYGHARHAGCPVPDSDKDGLNDEEDKCPTEAGLRENNGCPEIKQEIIEKVNFAARQVQFTVNKAELQPASLKILDEVATILEQNPGYYLSIEGHTSADGNATTNMRLSVERAENVKKYLVSKGIDASRLNAQGFGSSQPLNSGKTALEKAKNRRVELKLSNQ